MHARVTQERLILLVQASQNSKDTVVPSWYSSSLLNYTDRVLDKLRKLAGVKSCDVDKNADNTIRVVFAERQDIRDAKDAVREIVNEIINGR